MMKRNVLAVFGAALLAGWVGAGVLAQGGPPVAPATQGGPIVNAPGTAPTARAGEGVPSQPAVAVTEVKSPAAPAHYMDQALWALMVSFLIQWLKKSPWFGWITPATSARIKTQFGFIAALLTAAGVHFAVSGSIFDGGGASVTVSGLSINAFKDILWQWASQQAWYRLVVKEPREVQLIAPARPPLDLRTPYAGGHIDAGSVSEEKRNQLRGDTE